MTHYFDVSCLNEMMEEVAVIHATLTGPPDRPQHLQADVAVREDGDDHLYSRSIANVDLRTWNALGILQIILDELPEGALKVEQPEVSTPDLARRLPRTLRSLQAGQSKLHSD